MPKKVIPIRGSEEEHENWRLAAQNENMAFSAWARRLLNEASDDARAKRLERDGQVREREKIKATMRPGPQFALQEEYDSFKPDPKPGWKK